jgi:hypothetical protein
MDVILKHTTTDGSTYHEVDLTNKRHTVTTQSDGEDKTVTKRWGSTQKLVEKLVTKEITVVEEKIKVQRKTIGDCIYYNSTDHLEVTERKLTMNRELLEFLTSFSYEKDSK